jgi:hypothetical protein
MRSILLSLSARFQMLFIVGFTILIAFVVALFCSMFFDAVQLKANADLTSTVYQVMGTIYAILITFTLWGVWQSYTTADTAVQKEAYALMDLVHMVEASPRWAQFKIREVALLYMDNVIKQEWRMLKDMTSSVINLREQSHSASFQIVSAVQGIQPEGEREVTVYSHVLTILNDWLDARRTRLLIARGDSAHALWPLLVTGALVLFAFHGLFIAETPMIWATLLGGTALVIGLTFYLIFTLDCPFAGSPSIDTEPFYLAINLLKCPHQVICSEQGVAVPSTLSD